MSTPTTETGPRWFRRYARSSSPFRLFCFPHAGGSASMYRNWHDWLAPDIEVIAVELPGRGIHISEPAIDRMDVLVERVLAAMRPLLDCPFALFGHSLGSLIAFEVCRRLAATGGPEPQHLIVSAMAAPHLAAASAPIHHLPDQAFLEAVRGLKGTPPEVLADEGLLECFLGILRADFRLAETYRFSGSVRLRHPITAFAGVRDENCRHGDLEAWQEYTQAQCVVRWLPGDHFFLREQGHVVTAALLTLSTAAPDPGTKVAVA